MAYKKGIAMKTGNIIDDVSLQQFKLPVGDNQIAKIDYKKKDGKFGNVNYRVMKF